MSPYWPCNFAEHYAALTKPFEQLGLSPHFVIFKSNYVRRHRAFGPGNVRGDTVTIFTTPIRSAPNRIFSGKRFSPAPAWDSSARHDACMYD